MTITTEETIKYGDYLNGYTAEQLAEFAEVHVTTARRWIRDQRAPLMVAKCLTFMKFARLGAISKEWDGWSVSTDDGDLYSPEGERYTPGMVRAARINAQLNRNLRTQLDQAVAAVGADGERRQRIEALAELMNAQAQARAVADRCAKAAERLTQGLTASEENDLFQQLDSTREKFVEFSQYSRQMTRLAREKRRGGV